MKTTKEALGTVLGLITKYGWAVKLAETENADYDRLLAARAINERNEADLLAAAIVLRETMTSDYCDLEDLREAAMKVVDALNEMEGT